MGDKITSSQVKTTSKFDQHEIFKSGVEAIMQMLLNNISYRYYKYGLFLGVLNRYLTHHYKCPTDMITHALNSFNGNYRAFLEALQHTIKMCGHWAKYKNFTCTTFQKGGRWINPFEMFPDDDKKRKCPDTIEMTPGYVWEV